MSTTTIRPNTRKTVVQLHPLDACQALRPVETWERDMIDDGPPLRTSVRFCLLATACIGSIAVWIWAITVVIQWVQP